jgi:serine/threonine protein kinase
MSLGPSNLVPESDSDSSIHGRFLPGTRIAERYRIVSLAGRGGMGEFYRADDLKLGHPVALKSLPREVKEGSRSFQHFLGEVRLSRQIAHPNVCRVHDIAEVDGQHFLSMEYIDGEDLKGLLRRIGRLPKDKGIQIAQQLCAGLAAAHEKGVLHRDLKPANVMIDGRGQARITDFGLARLADGAAGADEIAGTPAYMAPEQLARGETTIQSDLYSLGLILHEVFTGQQVPLGATAGSISSPEAGDRKRLESLPEYMERAPVSMERLTVRPEGMVLYQGTWRLDCFAAWVARFSSSFPRHSKAGRSRRASSASGGSLVAESARKASTSGRSPPRQRLAKSSSMASSGS